MGPVAELPIVGSRAKAPESKVFTALHWQSKRFPELIV